MDSIQSPEDLKHLTEEEMYRLAKEIRCFLLKNMSKTGGHLASNLGVVELTLALHFCFQFDEDKIVWDVGHQAYIHKILTGRKEKFHTLRQLGGLSGFPKPCESEYDHFAAGHSSTSISAALGMAKARDLKGFHNHVLAVIGDGSITGGLAYEGLNNAGRENTNLIVILNDNQMSISKNVGGMAKHLSHLRTQPAYLTVKENFENLFKKAPVIGGPVNFLFEKIRFGAKYLLLPGVLFEELGFHYIGPVDGHNIGGLIEVLNNVKNMKGPILLHVKTTKGKGYPFAEHHPWDYHGVSAFEVKTGRPLAKNTKPDYSHVFGEKMVELGEKNEKIVGITAAMASGTGFSSFQARYPKRFFDVAIAEQHAVTFAAGLATQGMIPVFAVYSTFLQRAYDQIVHDVCLQNLHVIFAIDRAGIVGADGETHQGIFDISYLSHIPNMTLLSPKNRLELEKMLEFAVGFQGPIAIRYPRGVASEDFKEYKEPIVYGKAEVIRDGEKIAILAEGHMLSAAMDAARLLEKDGKNPFVVNMRFLKPLDESILLKAAEQCQSIFTIEDNLVSGGMGSKVLEFYSKIGKKISVTCFGFPDCYIEHGSQEQLFGKYGLDGLSIYEKIQEKIRNDGEKDG